MELHKGNSTSTRGSTPGKSHGNVYDNGKEQGWEQHEEEPKRRLALEETWGKSTTGVRGGVEWKGGSPPLTPAEASPTHRSVREACLPHTPVEEQPATRKEEEKPEHLYFQPFWLCKTLFTLFLRLEAIRYAPNPKK